MIALASVGELPTAASADTELARIGSAPPELAWTTPQVPAHFAEAPSLVSIDVLTKSPFASGDQAPGLEFSLNPDDEEILLGWRFEF